MDNVIVIMLIGQAIIIVSMIVFYSTRVKRVGPNEAIIVSGRGEGRPARRTEEGVTFRVVVGGRAFIWPLLETYEILSLETVRADLKLNKLATGNGGQVSLIGKMQYKIKSEKSAVIKAAQHFLSKTEEEKKILVMDVVENNLRRVVEGSMREEIEQSPMKFGDKMVEAGRPKMEEMGIEIVSLIIDEVR